MPTGFGMCLIMLTCRLVTPGCGTNLLRTTPAAALTFTSFELIARGLRQLAADQQAAAAAALTTQGPVAPVPAPPVAKKAHS